MMSDPWRQVDASGEVAHLIELLEERGSIAELAELRSHWLDFAGVQPGARVLDVGCGTGVVTRDLARRVGEQGRVVGVDPSRQFIQEAVHRARAEGLGDRIEFRCADGASLPCPDDHFDLVVASNVFSHIAHGAQVLMEMARVTRARGTVVVFDHDIDTIALNASDRALSRRIVHAYCDHHFTSGWAARELYGLFRHLSLGEIRVLPLVLCSTQFEGYWQQVVERSSRIAVEARAVTQEEAVIWRADLEEKGRRGRFFGFRTYVCVRGRKDSETGAPGR